MRHGTERALSSASWDGAAVRLEHLEAPVAVCDANGTVLGMSPRAFDLFEGLGIGPRRPPFPFPSSLWKALSEATRGAAIEWRPEDGERSACLGCTRYALGASHSIVLMQEVSAKRAQLMRRLHQQRLESTGRLVASISHDVRTALASILYNADFLHNAIDSLSREEVVTTVRDVHIASRRLQAIVDRLLDFAKLGPPVTDDVSLEDVLRRVLALVRPIFRERCHTLKAKVQPEGAWVRGNALVIDQILVNLLVNAAEASSSPIDVSVDVRRAAEDLDGRMPAMRVEVSDSGPGVPAAMRDTIFQPFFTTRTEGTGLGLTTSREAARELGGDLTLEPSDRGARFVLTLPGAAER